MKILLVLDQYDDCNNGTTVSAQRFAEGLTKRGHDVFIASTGKPAQNKFIVKPLPLPPGISWLIKSQGMVFALPTKDVLKESISKVDIVHFYLPFFLSRGGVKIAEELNVPHTAAFHSQPENITYTLGLGRSQKANDIIFNYYRPFYNRFSHVHCPSQFIADELKEHNYTSQLHVISNGIQPEFKYIKSNKTDDLKDKFVITMVGRYSNEKRQDLLFEAVNKSKYKDKIQVILAGKGPNAKKYAKLAKTLTNEPIMKFFSKEDLVKMLSMTDLYVHASDAEIEGISCIEAIACGIVPVIATGKKSATPQFALDERSLFEAGNASDLANKIDYWIENSEERKRMEHEYALSAEKYSIDKSMEQIEVMFYDAIKEHNSQQSYDTEFAI